jgi:hypothetical protein
MSDSKKLVRDLPARAIDGNDVKGGAKARKQSGKKSVGSAKAAAKFGAKSRIRMV